MIMSVCEISRGESDLFIVGDVGGGGEWWWKLERNDGGGGLIERGCTLLSGKRQTTQRAQQAAVAGPSPRVYDHTDKTKDSLTASHQHHHLPANTTALLQHLVLGPGNLQLTKPKLPFCVSSERRSPRRHIRRPHSTYPSHPATPTVIR